MPKLAVDIDDVLLPFYSSLASWHNLRTGSELSAEQLNEGTLSSAWGGEREYWVKQCNDFHAEGGSAAIDIFEDAKQSLEVLSNDFEIILLTSRPSLHRSHTEDWMNRHLSHVTNTLLMCEDTAKDGGSRHMDKGLIAKKVGAQTLIDDALHYIEASNAVGIRGILFGDYSWNRRGHGSHEHAKDWSNVLKLLGYNA